MDDDPTQHFATEDIVGGRLAHGYAVTVHRSQGLTVDATHALEDGGLRLHQLVQLAVDLDGGQQHETLQAQYRDCALATLSIPPGAP